MVSSDSKILQFGEELRNGVLRWVKAGQILVEILDSDPEGLEKVQDAYPTISRVVLAQLENVGRGVLHENLLTLSGVGSQALKRMPYSDQKKYINDPLEVYIERDGSSDILLVKLENLTGSQVRQVFAKDHIRSRGEQRAWIESEKMKRDMDRLPKVEKSPYTICRDGTVVFSEGVRMGVSELGRLIAEISKK